MEENGNLTETHQTLSLEEVYNIANTFIREKDGSAIHIPYADKNYLAALSCLVKRGTYKPELQPDLGLFDVVGRHRLEQWKRLGEMSAEDARVKYIETVNKICPQFVAVVEAHKCKQNSIFPTSDGSKSALPCHEEMSSNQDHSSPPAAALEIHVDTQRSVHPVTNEHMERLQAEHIADVQRKLSHEMELRAALKAQTLQQFQQYAEQHFPNDRQKQEELMEQLHEQHYQQYMIQVYQQQLFLQHQQWLQQRSLPIPVNQSRTTNQEPLSVMDSSTLQSHTTSNEVHLDVQSPLSKSPPDDKSAISKLPEKASQPANSSSLSSPVNGTPLHTDKGGQHQPGPAIPEQIDNSTQQQKKNIWNGKHWCKVENASMWTRKDIEGFKNSLKSDPEGILQIGSGEMVTVRVPTHKDGTSLFWEFSTDANDIGFGLFFEYSHVEENEGATESTQDCSSNHDKDNHSTNEADVKAIPQPQEVEIVSMFRRDSHKEVYCGSHVYPMHGVYLLRFDNTFSLWRSKTLYYRVYYSK